ncbi:Ycf66 family protein [Phormidesmis sp. 146-35]
MLTYLLAFAMGLGSLALYLSAFFYPQVYRKGDLIWSGIGLFYAWVLWVCAERITGGVLLGQMASISLIGWLGWQAFNARLGRSSELPSTTDLQAGVGRVLSPEITAKLKQQFNTVKDWAQGLVATTQSKAPEAPAVKPYQPLKREDFGQPTVTVETTAEKTPLAAKNDPSAETPANKPNIVSTVTERVKSIAISFQKPKKNTSTYVRKEFRDEPVAEDADAEAFDFEADSPEVSNSEPAQTVESIPVESAPIEAVEEAAIDEPTITETTLTETTVTETTVTKIRVTDVPSDSMMPADELLQEELEFEASRNDLDLSPHNAPPDDEEPTTQTSNPVEVSEEDVLEEEVPEVHNSEASEDEEIVPPPIPPRPPRPDLVEAAIADAEAKHLPADPPETIEDIS